MQTINNYIIILVTLCGVHGAPGEPAASHGNSQSPDHLRKEQNRKELPMKKIPLTKGQFTFIDDEDYEKIKGYSWFANKYLKGFRAVAVSKGKMVFMHRLIMNAPKGMDVDHINRNALDNQKSNLRICTRSQNNGNRMSYIGKSKFKGVWASNNINLRKRWRAEIRYENKRYHLGCFENQVEAAKAYDKKALKLFGDFAYLNFPKKD